MSDQTETALALPDPENVQRHLQLIDQEALTALEDAYNLLKGNQPDVASARLALQTVHGKIQALTEFGEQAQAIIAGLVEVANVAIGQRDDARAEVVELKRDFDEAVRDTVSDIFSYDSSIDDAHTEWLADMISTNGFESVAEAARADLEEQLNYAREISEYDTVETVDPLEEEQD